MAYRYNSSRAKCIKCFYCSLFFSPNKFVFHSHRLGEAKYVQPDAANFNSWRRHIRLYGDPPVEVVHAWEDVKAMFNGGTRKRLLQTGSSSVSLSHLTENLTLDLCIFSFQDRESSRSSKQVRKSPSYSSSNLKPNPSEIGNQSSYPSYFGALPPLAQSYPLPVAQKSSLDMRQSFVDYLWGSRGAIPPIGLPYSLPWPKRPLPSFPPFSLTPSAGSATASASESTTSLIENLVEETKSSDAIQGLRQTSLTSAFTPVSRPTPPSSPLLTVGGSSSPPPLPHPSSAEPALIKPWKREAESKEPPSGSLWEDVTVFPDSSRASDDEAVDIESDIKESPPPQVIIDAINFVLIRNFTFLQSERGFTYYIYELNRLID